MHDQTFTTAYGREAMTREAGIAFLVKDGPHLLVPCSRYGHDAGDCAPVAWRVAEIIADVTGEPITEDGLDYVMGLVVNDHDDVEYMLREHGTAARPGAAARRRGGRHIGGAVHGARLRRVPGLRERRDQDRQRGLRGLHAVPDLLDRPYGGLDHDRRGASGVRGVHWNKSRGKWMARVTINGKMKHRCYFDTVDEAAAAAAALYAEHHPYRAQP
jgi:hypothetical protein